MKKQPFDDHSEYISGHIKTKPRRVILAIPVFEEYDPGTDGYDIELVGSTEPISLPQDRSGMDDLTRIMDQFDDSYDCQYFKPGTLYIVTMVECQEDDGGPVPMTTWSIESVQSHGLFDPYGMDEPPGDPNMIAKGIDSRSRYWFVHEKDDGSVGVHVQVGYHNFTVYNTINGLGNGTLDVLQLQREIVQWQNDTFPDKTEETILNHLKHEVEKELVEGCDPSELADVLHLLIGLAAHRGIDLFGQLRDKFKINKARTWEKNDDIGAWTHTK